MIYDHIVKYNGTYYPAGSDVPTDNQIKKVASVDKANTSTSNDNKYTKTDIFRMSASELKKVAMELGLSIEGKTGSDLKKDIVSALKL